MILLTIIVGIMGFGTLVGMVVLVMAIFGLFLRLFTPGPR
jgi:hypothetical protein